jgi:capsular polysaccharide biosynthesis protein
MKVFLLVGGILLVVTGVILAVMTLGSEFMMPPKYAATASVLSSAATRGAIAAEVQEFQSNEVLTQVATNLDLPKRWGAKYHEGTLPLPMVWNLLKLGLEVSSTANSSVIQIRVTSDSPQEAADIANQTAEAYRAGARTVQILEKAMPVPRAVFPNKPRTLALGCGLGALLGLIGAALVMAFIKSPRPAPRDVGPVPVHF